ncbi:MAG: hypothetical protein OXQ96_07890, partial [Alphaproteobacteria bacterium]|nr:hypothetical protein [Alphaproteobacteria bacterium]
MKSKLSRGFKPLINPKDLSGHNHYHITGKGGVRYTWVKISGKSPLAGHYFLVSRDDYRTIISQSSAWWASYSDTKKVTVYGNIDDERLILTQLIWQKHHPDYPTNKVFKKGHVLDFRLQNLTSNLHALHQQKDYDSGYFGVFKNGTKWIVKVPVQPGGYKEFGPFDDPIKAADKYNSYVRFLKLINNRKESPDPYIRDIPT